MIDPYSGCIPRRRFLQAAGLAAGSSLLSFPGRSLFAAEDSSKRPQVAAVFTSCNYRSHAHVILENFLEPYPFNGKKTDPGVDVVAFYADQFPDNDMARGISRDYKIPLYRSINETLCRGGNRLAVDGVVSIGEHGNYPVNDLGQREYPRKRFFDEIVAVMKQSKRFVPIFNDKHLSYRWDWSKEMVDTAKKHGIPFLAGSSVPLAQRIPPMEMPKDAEIEEAVSVHGGPLESYDFHGLEVLQSMVEFRKGGETGVSSVEFLTGDALWKAAEEGRWSLPLARKALKTEFGDKLPASLKDIKGNREYAAHALLLTYKDGLKATVLRVGYSGTRWCFACKLKDDPKPLATRFYVGPWQNRNLFKALSHAIQRLIITGVAPYPVERTLMTAGILESAMRARREGQGAMKTPQLEFAYQPKDFKAMREMGASWKIITEDVPQPRGINPYGRKRGI